MGFFSNRRKRESAIPESADAQALGSFASPESQPAVGQEVSGGQFAGADGGESPEPAQGLAALTQLGPMIEMAMSQGKVTTSPDGGVVINAGNVSIEHAVAQPNDMRGTDLGAEIREIMSQHGIVPGAGLAPDVDPDSLAGMQQQILQALTRRGIDPNATGSSQPGS